jgi:lipopolysaccharide export LptBFGC system permease protein LptF
MNILLIIFLFVVALFVLFALFVAGLSIIESTNDYSAKLAAETRNKKRNVSIGDYEQAQRPKKKLTLSVSKKAAKQSRSLAPYGDFNERNFEKAKLKARLSGHTQFMYHGDYYNCRYGGN